MVIIIEEVNRVFLVNVRLIYLERVGEVVFIGK